MAHKHMTVDQVIEYLNSDESGNADYAFRGDDYVPAHKFRKSKYHGDDGLEYQLPGVSAINIPSYSNPYIRDAICRAREYGNNVFLLRGEQQNADEINHDPDECLIVSNQIVCIIDANFQRVAYGTRHDYKITNTEE